MRASGANHIDKIERLLLPPKTLKKLEKVCEVFPLRVPLAIYKQIKMSDPHCPIRRQLIPDPRELSDDGSSDPLLEERFMVAPGVIQRFEDRIVALVSKSCPLHCRHCNRKRYWKRPQKTADPEIIARVLSKKPAIKEVILSGGDPLMLSDRALDQILKAARTSRNVELVRIHSRMPFSQPARFTPSLMKILKRHQPLWFLTQFNHAYEISYQSRQALAKLKSASVPLLNQAVLLKGVNDSVKAQVALGRALVSVGVKPYYLFQLDQATGTLHFQVPFKKAIKLADILQRKYSGLIVPKLMVDFPGRAGKQQLTAGLVDRFGDKGVYLRSRGGRARFFAE